MVMQSMGMPMTKCPWCVVSPRSGCQASPCTTLSHYSQGAGPAWHRDRAEQGMSLGGGSILAAPSR